ncbi:signal peptidase I [Patescibacteria group bacterium]|nr:signal peptidase I [Patescibacteria group bacterium]
MEAIQTYSPIVPLSLTKKRSRCKHFIKEWGKLIVFALLVALLVRLFVYRVNGGSMETTLLTGDFVFVDKISYRFTEPQVGDIIVFEYPLNPSKDFIKRIVARPGQRVEIVDKKLYVDDKLVPDAPGVIHTDPEIIPELFSPRDNFGPFTLPEGQYFVMGDNRDDSQDSRFWGFLERKHIIGKAQIICFSLEPGSFKVRFDRILCTF